MHRLHGPGDADMISKPCQSGLHCFVCRTDARQREACGLPEICPRGLDAATAAYMTAEALERLDAVAADLVRVGAACRQCREVEDSTDADDCEFVGLCPADRRARIKNGSARCPAGRWTLSRERSRT